MTTNVQAAKSDTTKNDWAVVTAAMKTKFTKLTDLHIESLKGNIEQLSAKLQSVYGYAKEKAESESKAFKATLKSATDKGTPVAP